MRWLFYFFHKKTKLTTAKVCKSLFSALFFIILSFSFYSPTYAQPKDNSTDNNGSKNTTTLRLDNREGVMLVPQLFEELSRPNNRKTFSDILNEIYTNSNKRNEVQELYELSKFSEVLTDEIRIHNSKGFSEGVEKNFEAIGNEEVQKILSHFLKLPKDRKSPLILATENEKEALEIMKNFASKIINGNMTLPESDKFSKSEVFSLSQKNLERIFLDSILENTKTLKELSISSPSPKKEIEKELSRLIQLEAQMLMIYILTISKNYESLKRKFILHVDIPESISFIKNEHGEFSIAPLRPKASHGIETIYGTLGRDLLLYTLLLLKEIEPMNEHFTVVLSARKNTVKKMKEHFTMDLTRKEYLIRKTLIKNTDEYIKEASSLLDLLKNTIYTEDPSSKKALHILKGSSSLENIESRYNVQFEEKTLEHLIDRVFQKQSHNPDSIYETITSQLIDLASKNQLSHKKVVIQPEHLFSFLKEAESLPFDPADYQSIKKFKQDTVNKISEKIIGQNHIIEALVDSYIDLITNEDKERVPVRSLLIPGPSGIGKSSLAQAFSKTIFEGSRDSFFTIDGSTYQDKHSTSSLSGSSKGYIGSDQKTEFLTWLDQLIEKKQGGVLIIDDADKAHMNFWKVFMPLLEKGVFESLSDTEKRTVESLIVIVTTNRGQNALYPSDMENWEKQDIKDYIKKMNSERKSIIDKIQAPEGGHDKFLIPNEVLGRFDHVIMPNPIFKPQMALIVNKIVKDFSDRQQKNLNVTFAVNEELIDHYLKIHFHFKAGVRPVEKAVKSLLKEALKTAEEKLGRERLKNTRILLSLNDKRPDKPEIEIFQITKDKRKNLIASKKTMQSPDMDPFFDQALNSRLEKAIETLNKRLVGQEEFNENVARILSAHYSNPARTKPLVLYLIGPPGTGKTELGRTLSEILVGEKTTPHVISLSQVRNSQDLAKTLGHTSDISSDVSGKIGPLESFLRKNSQRRGVLILDEASNLGGGNPREKEALFKELYSLVENDSRSDTKWTSPVTKETYSLKDITIVLTGNDGAELTQDILSEQAVKEIYNKMLKKESLARKILRENHVPEAFVSRLSFVAFSKPLLEDHLVELAKKFLKNIKKSIDSTWSEWENSKVLLKYDDNFLKKFSAAFFSSHDGARSLRNVIDTQLTGLITEARKALHNTDIEKSNKTVELQLKMDDNLSKNVQSFKSEEEALKYNRNVKLRIVTKVYDDNKVLYSEARSWDLTNLAQVRKKLSHKNAIITAYHEAGHAAVFSDPRLKAATNSKVNFVTIQPKGNAAGLVDFGPRNHEVVFSTPSQEMIVWKVAGFLAGGISQQMLGYGYDAGMRSDLDKARRLIDIYVKNYKPKLWHLDSENRNHKKIEREKEMLFQKAKSLAFFVLKENENLIHKTVQELLKKGFISGDDYSKLRDSYGVEVSGRYHEVKSFLYYMRPSTKLRYNSKSIVRNPTPNKERSLMRSFIDSSQAKTPVTKEDSCKSLFK